MGDKQDTEFDLGKYLTGGVERIVREALRATLRNPEESAFMAKYLISSRRAAQKRADAEARGEHIPPFLIASITSSCNLHCAGCYARENQICSDTEPLHQLSAERWKEIFTEANDLGVGFVLLAGGEPLLRRDILEAVGSITDILFPVFTNGMMIDEQYLRLFDRSRNLVPVLSIEGNQAVTDERRGNGVYQRLIVAMERLKSRQLIFGVSITVTTGNLHEVMSVPFLDSLKDRGCKVVFYIEFVPVSQNSADLAPQDKERAFMKERLDDLRMNYPDIVFISFPGDEKSSGGCLAAGRGFFHINSHGDAEPCPFSPYSDINVAETSLKEALHSDLFQALQTTGLLNEDHPGGCVLFERKSQVETLLAGKL